MIRIINLELHNFKAFLEKSLSEFSRAVSNLNDTLSIDELRNDWLQANWEILVETIICKPGEEFLEVYGEGAECNGASSRVCYPNVLPTHKVTCKQNDKKSFVAFDQFTKKLVNTKDGIFHSFVFFDGKQYYQNEKINAALLERDGETFLFYLNEIDFVMYPTMIETQAVV